MDTDERLVDLLPWLKQQATRLARVPQVEKADLVQDAALALLQMAPRYDGRRPYITFGYLRGRGAMLDALRRVVQLHDGERTLLPSDDRRDPSKSALEVLIQRQGQRERRVWIRRVLRTLNARERRVLRRLFVDRAPIMTIAAECERSPEWVWWVRRRIVERFRLHERVEC